MGQLGQGFVTSVTGSPLNTVRKYLYIGWYCSDGDTALGQPEVALRDGERVVLSCDRSSVGDPSLE